MVPILYYDPANSCTFGAIVALEWLCRPYHLLRLELPGQHSPVLATDRRVMHDCRGILRHIASQRRSLLGYKPGTVDHQRLERLLDRLHEGFQSGPARLLALCAILDAQLENREWLDGNKRTVADACLVAAVRWARQHAGMEISRYSHLQHYIEQLHKDPAVFFADAIESQRPAVSSGRFRGQLQQEDLPLAA